MDLLIVSNALNEVLHGPNAVPHREFATRMGASRQASLRLLRRLLEKEPSSHAPLTLTCPHCGAPFQVPAHIRALPENEMQASNLAVMCAECARDFDQALEDGVYSRLGGRASLVHALRDGTRLILNENPSIRDVGDLIDALKGATSANLPVADAVRNVAGFEEFERWARHNPATAKVVGGLLVIILTALAARLASAPEHDTAPPPTSIDIIVRRPPESEMQRLIDQALDERARAEANQDQSDGSRAGQPPTQGAP